ncbi:MAG: LysR family transcriptional regulator [Lachnospiraceae bacterium]
MEHNLSLYRIFYTVAGTESISKAARELYISQPAISKSISRLEESLHTTLFTRNSRGVTLTSEGRILYTHVKTAFEALDRGEKELAQIHDLGIGHIHLGVSTTLCKYLLLPYLKGFVVENPHINISIETQDTFQTLKMLENQKLDIGVVAKQNNFKNIHFYPVTEIEDIFVASPSYLENFYLREGKQADWISQGNIMLLDSKNNTRQFVDQYLSTQQLTIRHQLEISTMDLVIEFAKIGLGIGCCIKECVSKELQNGTLIQLPLPVPMEKRTLGFATSSSGINSLAVQHFMTYVTHHSCNEIL